MIMKRSGEMTTIIPIKDLITGTNKEDWHHFTVTPRSKEQAEELRDAFKQVVREQGEKMTEEYKKIYEYFMGIRKG
jgi:ABC-type Zn uptake system ZnuABC Zn-binding protein ZnuA